jgi:hypothetical protein
MGAPQITTFVIIVVAIGQSRREYPISGQFTRTFGEYYAVGHVLPYAGDLSSMTPTIQGI